MTPIEFKYGEEIEMDIQPQINVSLEGRAIKAGNGTGLTVISVTAAVAGIGKYSGLAAIEGGVANLSRDGSGFEMNCVSQVF